MNRDLEHLTQTLAQSEARNRAVLEAAVDSIITIDEHGIVQSVNSATTKTFGYSESEIIGQNISLLMPAPYSTEHDEYIHRYLRTGVRRIIGIGREVVGRRKDGSTFPLELSVSEVLLPDVRLFTGIIRDITDRKQVEEALLAERTRFQHYLEIAAVAVIGLDPAGRIQLLNHRASELLDLTEKESLGRVLTELLPQAPHFAAAIAQALSSSDSQKFESLLVADGTPRYIAWQSSRLTGNGGGSAGTLLAGTDITERVLAQESLEHAQRELEQRVVTRTQELSRTNDELREEIAERIIVQSRLAESLAEKEVLLKEIHHRVKNNLQLVSSLLSLQVRSSKRLTVDQLVYEIQGRIQSIALLHEMLYQGQDLVHIDVAKYIESLAQTISQYYGAGARVTMDVRADPVRLSLDQSIYCGLLLNELITNSLKHAFPGGRNGTITIEARQHPVGSVTVSVTDNGVGLKADFDLQKATTLGLELVQQLASKLHGDLNTTSEHGAAFEVTFPYQG